MAMQLELYLEKVFCASFHSNQVETEPESVESQAQLDKQVDPGVIGLNICTHIGPLWIGLDTSELELA